MAGCRRLLIRLLAAATLLCGVVRADDRPFVEIREAEGSRVLRGRPVAVVTTGDPGVVRIERPDGSHLDLPLDRVAADDRGRLRQWMERCQADPRAALVRRVATAKQPAVLFIGNSYSFQVPGVFRQISANEGRAVTVEQVTAGGWPLAKHAASEKTLAAIRSRKWDVVVLQEQSLVPAFPAGQRDATMLPPLASLAQEITAAGAVPALYQTWGRRDGDRDNAAVFPADTFAAMHARLADGFAAARARVPALAAVPAGDAWAARVAAGRGATLYQKDGSHPSPQGVFLTAAVFFSSFYNTPVKKHPPDIADAPALAELAFETGRLRPPPY